MSDDLTSLPAGRINKRYTGIGATYLELHDISRNSVIVVPTRALAATKAVNGVFYLGSPYNGKTADAIESIIYAIKENTSVKIMVVADTFVNVFYKHREFFLGNFHLVIDEVDSFQSESGYRDALHHTIDIYKQFAKPKRTMISATLQEFFDIELLNEPICELIKKDHQPVEMKLINSQGEMPADLSFVINEALEQKPDEKILVAYNSIQGILQTIACLNKNSIVGVLCSETNLDKIPLEMQSSLNDGRLQKQVTFITSAYFIGIDILDKASVIVAGDTSADYRALTKAKIYQIFGRIRPGSCQNTFIFNTIKGKSNNLKSYKRFIISLCKTAESITLKQLQAVKKAQKLNSIEMPTEDEIMSFHKIKGISLVRLAKVSDKVKINWLAIEYLYQQQQALNEIYRDPERTNTFFQSDYDLRRTDFSQIEYRVTLQDQARYEDIRKGTKESQWKQLMTYIDSFCSKGYYGAVPECPDKYRDLMDDFETTASSTGDCKIIQELLLLEISANSLIGMEKLANDLRFLRCWSDEQLGTNLMSLLGKLNEDSLIRVPLSMVEIRAEITPLKSRIEKIAVQKINISDEKRLKLLLGKLYVIKRVGRNKDFKLVSPKRAAEFLDQRIQENSKGRKLKVESTSFVLKKSAN